MLDYAKLMKERHSVRSFSAAPLGSDVRHMLDHEIMKCNEESGLHITLACDEPMAFRSFMAHYGKFRNVNNYLVLAGRKSPYLDEVAGFYGEHLVLLAQSVGLKTCWVGLTFSKKAAKKYLRSGEELVCVIAVGWSDEDGREHPSKDFGAVSETKVEGAYPDWFRAGVEAALLAPTALNQQKFRFVYERAAEPMPRGVDAAEVRSETVDATEHDRVADVAVADSTLPVVSAYSLGGPYSNVDLGIAKYHFMLGAGAENFQWGIHQQETSKVRSR